MIVEGLLLSPMIASSLKAQVETFVAYIFTTDIVLLTVVEIVSVFKKRSLCFYLLSQVPLLGVH